MQEFWVVRFKAIKMEEQNREGAIMSELNKKNWVPVICIGMLILAMVIISGCEGTREPTTTGSDGSGINLSAPVITPGSVEQGSTSIVEVTVTNDNGSQVADAAVTFEVSPSTGGTFTPITATTDANGIASTVFTASQPGTHTIAASSNGAYSPFATVSVSSTTQQTSGNISVQVTPSLMTADGSSTATVVIRVRDENDNAPGDSTVVKLTAGERFFDVDGDGYFTSGVDTGIVDVNANNMWDPVGIIPAIAYTEAGSVAVSYTAGTVATTSYIKATVNEGGVFDGSNEASILLTPDAAIYAIELSSEVTGVQVRHTGGQENTTLDAICWDVNGNLVPEGLSVQFLILDGPNGGENIMGLGLGPVTAQTDANGVASVEVWSGTISGTMEIRATAGTVLSNATFVTVYAGPPYYISVGSDFCNMDGWNTTNREMYVDAVVADLYHNPVQDSVTVYFTVDEGVIDAYGITSDSTGVAKAIFRTGEPQTDGLVWVWAETSGGSVVGSTLFINSYIPAVVYLTMSPQMLLADGKSEATFWADVRDLNNNLVLDRAVETKTLYGAAGGGVTTDGCNASVFEGGYVAPVLDQDYSVTGVDDDGIGGIDFITARSGFVSSSIPCTLTTSWAFYKESSIEMDATDIPYSATGIPIRVVIKDRYSNPLADHTLNASLTPAGTLTVGTDETNTFGEAFDFRFNAPAAPPPDIDGNIPDTPALITIIDTDPRGGGLVMTAKIKFTAE
jgi:hypothetical protein